MPKNFKDLTRDRLEMNARLEPKKDPQGPGDRGQAQGPGLDQHGQAAAERGDHVPSELHGAEHRPRPKALGEEGLTSASPVSLSVNNDPAQDRPRSCCSGRSG